MRVQEGARSGAKPQGATKARGLLWNNELGIRIPFQYHPEEITEQKSLNWNTTEILGVGQPLLSYGGGDVRVLQFQILLDAHSSPHPDGHVEADLAAIRYLSVPWGIDNKPTIQIPEGPGGRGSDGRLMYRKGPGRVAGVPPVVKIQLGGRTLRGVLRNLEIREVLHGTTPQARGNMACTRAYVSFEFIVIEDSRMLVHWQKQFPKS